MTRLYKVYCIRKAFLTYAQRFWGTCGRPFSLAPLSLSLIHRIIPMTVRFSSSCHSLHSFVLKGLLLGPSQQLRARLGRRILRRGLHLVLDRGEKRSAGRRRRRGNVPSPRGSRHGGGTLLPWRSARRRRSRLCLFGLLSSGRAAS